jgi:serine/threonine protein kinase/ABC-type transport system substrate-binding protein
VRTANYLQAMRSQVPTGTVLAGFRVESLIGEGAMGAVYLAEDTRTGERVALKVLAPELARDERFRQRFLRESQLAASLDHPHIVPTLASGEENGTLYLAMAYVEGSDLRDLLRREGRLEPERAIDLLKQVAEALDAAHAAGLVHRDVKPGNTLVTGGPEGEQAFVCDFGLARHFTSVSSLTGERGFVGTIDYVPPEQIEGGQIDGRADVYSLGCVLFECLAGERPFDRESELSVVFAHLNEPPPRLSDVRPELPEAFDAVFATALAKSPDDRYSSCGELAAAAQAALQGKTFIRKKRRRRRLLIAAAALAVATGGTMGGILTTRGAETTATSTPPISLRPNALNFISADSRRVIGHVGLGSSSSSPYPAYDVVAAGRSAWVLAGATQHLLRVSLATHRIDWNVKLPWPAAGRIAVGGGFVWVTQDGGAGVVGVDGHTGRIARRFHVDGGNGTGIAYGAGSLWLAQGDDVARIDPDSGRVLHRILVRPGQSGSTNWLLFADGSLWSAKADDGVIRKFDPVANRLVSQITLHGWVSDLAVAGGDVLVPISQDGVLYRLNEDDLSVAGTRPAGLDPERISTGAGNVWVANVGGAALSGISQLTGARRELRTNARPQTATYSRGILLAVASPAPLPLPPIRGEEIRISTPSPVLNLDPATPSNVQDNEVLYATCANLLGYPDAPGRLGGMLRPDAAAAMPTVSRDGRTYTFRIRSGFRFSPPSNEPVTAQTFKHTIERALSRPFSGRADSEVTDIVGEDAFRAGKVAHISGIATRGSTLRITLTRPAGDFLTRISMPFFCPVPSTVGTRMPSAAAQIPRDGPYYVASVTSDRVVLLRNPNYGGSRPRRPARIVFESGTPTPQAVALTDRGQLDYLPPDFQDDSLLGVSSPLDRRYGAGSAAARAGDQRYIYRAIPAWDGVVLNAARPLFRDIRMRRAVEYALDRRTLARNYADLPSDGIVPPAVPGFGAQRVYPLAPDLGQARRLAGPGRRKAMLYYCTNGPFGGTGQARVAALIRTELARIGIAVSIVAPPCGPNSRYDAHSRQADLILASVFNPVLDPERFLAAILSRDNTLGSALGRGLWTQRRFLAHVRRAHALRGTARLDVYRQLERELLRAAPIAVFGSFYEGHYFSRRVGCRIIPLGVGAVDLGALCKRI